MTIRRALFLGGAVLVLAACNDATSPMATAKQGGSVAATRAAQPTPMPNPNTTSIDPVPVPCRSGYVVGSGGRDSTSAGGDSTCAVVQ